MSKYTATVYLEIEAADGLSAEEIVQMTVDRLNHADGADGDPLVPGLLSAFYDDQSIEKDD